MRDVTTLLREQVTADHKHEAEVVEPSDLSIGSGANDKRRRLEATCAEGHVLPVQEHPLGGLREGERRQRQVKSAEPQRRQRAGVPTAAAMQRADWETPAQNDQPRCTCSRPGRVGADAEHGGVGERELSGVADEDVEADRQQDVDDDEIGRRTADRPLANAGARSRRSRAAPAGHCVGRRAPATLSAPCGEPSRPLGRSTSTSMMTTNGDTSITLEWM